MLKKNIPKDTVWFLLLVSVTVLMTYKAPRLLTTLWYIFTLVLYYRSKDEAFWLAFYLVTVDGFFGFLGVYTVTIQLLPGLPAIELAQFYIILTLIKALQIKSRPLIFYKKYLAILLLYLIFLIIWGQMMGFSGGLTAYFRILKLSLPFILFYSLPRLLTTYQTYRRLFGFIFIVFLGAFATQLFVLLSGILPAKIAELSDDQVAEAGAYRGFYNVGITLLGLFGALFYLSERNSKSYDRIYLFIIIISTYGMAYLSATRGWIVSFSIIIILSFVLASGTGVSKVTGFVFVFFIAAYIGLSNNKIKEQIDFANERLKTLGAVTEGDLTAGGTLARIAERGPRVMKVFKENPIFGWGFSDTSRKYSDGHVGNQTLLLHSGIVGFVLLTGFLFYFSIKLTELFLSKKRYNPLKTSIPVFIIFLAGWFIIHSTSGQHFNYMGIPAQVIPQVIFFSLGSFVYSNSKKITNG
jgi:hypothetical protein